MFPPFLLLPVKVLFLKYYHNPPWSEPQAHTERNKYHKTSVPHHKTSKDHIVTNALTLCLFCHMQCLCPPAL